MAVKARSGKGGRVTTGAAPTTLNLKEWNTDNKADDLDTTTFESSGKDCGTTGIEGVDYSFKGDFDAGLNPFDTPAIYPQDALATTKLYENVTDNLFWSFPVSRVLSAKNGAPVRQLVTFDATLKSNGAFSRPSGSV